MSGLVTMQQSRFNEILEEELKSIKKQLTEAQINLLCGPTESVNAALNEVGLGRDVMVSTAHERAVSDEMIARHEAQERLCISHDDAEAWIKKIFGRIQDINNPKQWEIDNTLQVIIHKIWCVPAGGSSWSDLNWIRQNALRQILKEVYINDVLPAWSIVHPFVRMQDEQLADDIGLTALRDFVVDSSVFNVIANLLGGAALVGSAVLVAWGAPAWVPVAAGTAAFISAGMFVVKGLAQISRGDKEEGAMSILSGLLLKMGQAQTVRSAGILAQGLVKTMKDAFAAGGHRAVKLSKGWAFLKDAFHTLVIGAGLLEGIFMIEDIRADFPLRWNYTSGCDGEKMKERWLANYIGSTQSYEDAEWLDCAGNLIQEQEDEIRVMVANGSITLHDDHIQVEDTSDAAKANEIMAMWGEVEAELPDTSAEEAVEALDSLAPSLQESKLTNCSLVLSESRFQKLAGI